MARNNLSEAEWRLIEPLLPNKSHGVARVDNQRVINVAGFDKAGGYCISPIKTLVNSRARISEALLS